MLVQPSAADKPSSYDGRWWLTIDDQQRIGFVVGFVDCYSNLVDHHTQLIQAGPRLGYVPRLTKYLREHPDAVTDSVESLLLKIASPPYARVVHHPESGNETLKELKQKWGPYDDGDQRRVFEVEQPALH